MSSKLYPFPFEESGITIQFKKVNPFVLDKIQESIPMPEVPLQEVKNADGTTRMEPNPDHPSMRAKYAARGIEIDKVMRRFLCKTAIVIPPLSDEQKQEVADFREATGPLYDDEKDDRMIYLLYIVMVNQEEYMSLFKQATGQEPIGPKSESGSEDTVSP